MRHRIFGTGLLSGAVIVLPLLVGSAAHAQTSILPGSEAAKRADKAAGGDTESANEGRLSTYNMPAVTVRGAPTPLYKDDELIGEYAQPRWTAQRLFAGTRVYVIPKGEVDFEQWFRFEKPKGGGPTTVTTQSEIEIGLPNRFQLDIYLNTKHESNRDSSGSTGASAEIRWAFADWGKIWGNPALYLEYTTMSREPDMLEGKILLGDSFAPGWHWGANLSVEQQLAGERTTEKQFTAGVSNSVIDHVLELGVESRLGWTNAAGSRSHYERDLQIGPSLRWRPVRQMHVDFAPLFGLTHDSQKVNAYVIVGWEM
jgi:hypothetical protein